MKKIYFLLITVAFPVLLFGQAVPNAGMENWRSNTSGSSPAVTVNAPISWYGFDSLIIADEETFLPLLYSLYHPTHLHAQLYQEGTIVNSGSSSAKVMTLKQDTIGIVPGSLSNASVSVNALALIGGGSLASASTFHGGSPVTMRITTVSAYVQYMPGIDSVTGLMGGNDTGLLTVQTYGHIHGNDTLVGTGVVQILPTSGSFAQITANVVYWDTAYVVDTVRIIFSSSGGGASKALDSSTLYVDDVSMTGVVNPDYTGVPGIISSDLIKVYPNPASGTIYFDCPQNSGFIAVLYSVNGQAVATKTLTGSDALDVSTLPAGLYFYAVFDKNGSAVQRGKVAVSK